MIKYTTEEILIGHLRQGDKKAFQHLYSRYSKALLKAILLIVKDPDEAEDLLQDTYVKVWQRFHYYNPELGTLFTWLLKVARNTALSALTRRKLVYSTLDIELNDVAAVEYGPVVDAIGVEYLVKGALSNREWQVINMAYWQGYTHEEIATQLALPVGTVKSRIYKSISRLRPIFNYTQSSAIHV
ncbi:RNA polymerase sigma factor [Spirosoma flavum]|uniref:RNA polymerase sigma factor n=1 Tax=Spirosoma flavum TaxID=2048557 RepID=A0ABW6AKE8_9BACT